jgi:ankyrin repeat protein
MGIFNFSKRNVSPEEWINAAKSRNIEEMKLLFKKGADVNAAGKDGFTALMAVSLKGHTEVVKFLLDKGADVDATKG